jgi:hypothetical protein
MTIAAQQEKEQYMADLARRQVELMKEMKNYRNKNLLEFFNKPKGPPEMGMPANPLQAELIDAWENQKYKVFTYSGANRIGKTTILTIICLSVMFGRWLWNDKRLYFPHNEPRKCRIIGQAWEQHIKAVLIPELRKWWPIKRGVNTKKNNNGVEYFWEDQKTGSTLEIMSNMATSDVMEGWYGDFIGYDEPPSRENRIACSRGLIDREGRELFCMTLLKEAWVDREVIKRVDEDGLPDRTIFSVDGDIQSNVGFGITEKGVEQFAKTLSEDEISARIHGKPSYMSGLVYPTFKRKVHLCERFEVPLNWIVDIGIDTHPRKKHAVLFVATNEKQERYAVDEILEHGDGDYLADEILRKVARNKYRVGNIIIDPLSKGDDQNDEKTTYNKINKKLFLHNYFLQLASKDISSGILAVKEHLLGPNKKPSLFFFEDLIRTLYEIEGYMWDKETGKPLKEKDDMMENLYRILLLDTQYTDPEDEDYEEEQNDDNVNPVTGY